MTTGYTYPSATNVYVPSTEATNELLVGYSRNPDKFLVAKYAKYVPVTKMFGLYRIWLSQQGARIITTNDAEHVWADGASRPDGQKNTEATNLQKYLCQRRNYPVTLGDLTIEQADFAILAAHSGESAMAAMTSRTLRSYNTLTGYTGWGSNTGAVNGSILPAGQNWTNGTPDETFSGTTYVTGPNVKVSFQFSQIVINKATFATVKPKDLMNVMNPTLASKVSQSAEIQNFIKQSPSALAQLRGDSPNQNGMWGLPTVLYATDILIEDTVVVKSRQNATVLNQAYVWGDTVSFMLARPGELEGIEGSPDFSTLQLFFYKDEMTVEQFHDVPNKRQITDVVVNDNPNVVSPLSGYYFTACA
jgi:hypothetical protein